jgi:hypothetical protein
LPDIYSLVGSAISMTAGAISLLSVFLPADSYKSSRRPKQES